MGMYMNRTKIKSQNSNFLNDYDSNLTVTDLDEFFSNSYEYFKKKGYRNILTQFILDNIIIMFTVNFFFISIFMIDWSKILLNCKINKQCNINLYEILEFSNFFSNYFTLFLYLLFLFYYIFYLLKSLNFLLKMRIMKNIYRYKFKIRQRDLENIEYTDIINRMIELQKQENFCRVKDNLTTFDVISRIMRKDNYLNALISNKKLVLDIKIPLIGEINMLTEYTYTHLKDCLIDYAFPNGEANISKKFISHRKLQLRIISTIITEIIIIIPLTIIKLVIWVSRNADNIKSKKNLNKREWSFHQQILIRNYNELDHIFENRINQSNILSEKYIDCFKVRVVSIISKFLSIMFGSILIVLFLISTFNEEILTEISLFNKKIIWYGFFIGIIVTLTSSSDDNQNITIKPDSNEFIISLNDTTLKKKLYKDMVNTLMNIPEKWRIEQNLSCRFKQIQTEFNLILKKFAIELFSVLLFPYLWWKLLFQTTEIIYFIRSYSINIEGVGDICCFSSVYLNKLKILKERNLIRDPFNERKALNSFIFYQKIYSSVDIANIINYESNELYLLEKRLFDKYIKMLENDKDRKITSIVEKNLSEYFEKFRKNIFYNIIEMENKDVKECIYSQEYDQDEENNSLLKV